MRAADSNVGNAGAWSGSKPTANSSWYEAAKFANWLTTGNAYAGAYQFDSGGVLTAVNRAAAVSAYGTVYVLPTENEWYKAAYLKSDGSDYTLYATGNSIPTAGTGGENYNGVIVGAWNVGSGTTSSIENNGTFDMSGNIWEWNESALDGTLNNMAEARLFRGGSSVNSGDNLRSSNRYGYYPTSEHYLVGFRIAVIPEPSTVSLLGLGAVSGILLRRRDKIAHVKRSPLSCDKCAGYW